VNVAEAWVPLKPNPAGMNRKGRNARKGLILLYYYVRSLVSLTNFSGFGLA